MKKGKFTAVLSIAIVFILIVTGCLVIGVYNGFLKPDDFNDYIICSSGDDTGYYRHCYNELNENEKKIYNVILPKLYNSPEKIEIPQLNDCDLQKIFKAISLDNPDLFNIGLTCKAYKSGYKTYFTVEYAMDNTTYQNQLKEAKAVAQVIIDGAKEFSSDYDKEKYVHDYIINHATYVESKDSPNANTIYGCLVEGKASCEGYSRAFQYILNNLNIDNRLVTGEAAADGVNFIPHMWNFVNIDGKQYFTDVTWDDPEGESNIIRHTYFNVNTADILLKHRNIEQAVPLITDNTYNYFVKENCYSPVGSGNAFETIVSNAVFTAKYNNLNSIEIRFPNGAVMAQAKNALFNDGVIYNVYTQAGFIAEGEQNAQVYYVDDSAMNTICLFF